SSENPQGWIKPEDLSAAVTVENLFGTPAQQRRVAATIVLRPAFPSFPAYPDYRFFDPQLAKQGYDETLSDAVSDKDGHAKFAIDLKKYERATYQLNFLALAYEPGSGRNVAAQTKALVSSNDYLVGIKSQDDLGFVKRNARRVVQLLTIGQDGKPKQVAGLHAVVVEKRYVSVLTKQDSGIYRYVSHERRFDRKDQPLQLAAGRQVVTLPTDQPGEFVLEVRGSDGKALNQINFSVAGAANLSRSLERNAELALSLSKPSYSPGETIDVSVRAPYPGSGLITLERDRVYAHVWFRADTTSSVQKIQVPADFEGNGYVNVQFLRDPNSDEIFMSPLSYGVAPFAVDRAARTQPLRVSVPAVAKPGVPITVDVTTQGKARVVLFAVDEGILQVARYRVGDPLDHFFKKKMLQVGTAQILDLMLPEFSRIAALSAPGGDAEGDLAKHLNPFKRKSEKPAVWWSGIFDVDGHKQLKFTMPDHFNGQVRVVAVAVTPERIGLAETKMLIRGDFVLTPTVPTHLAPGDEFELPVGVANTIAGAKSAATIATTLQLPPSLTLVGAAPAALSLAPGREGTVRFRLRAGNALGAAPIVVVAQSGKYRAQRRIELSLRPAIVARQDILVGRADHRILLKNLRTMFDQRATRQLSASVSPLVALDGLTAYLNDYPHLCTEQLLSEAMPALVLGAHPEFGKIVTTPTSQQPRTDLIDVLRSRQNSEGGLGLWMATPDADPFVSGYAAVYLLEARERGRPVPDDMLASLNRYLEAQAADRSGNDLPVLRSRALAVYLLIRQGRTTSNLLGAVHEQLKRDQPRTWENDVAGLFIAASYQLLQQDKAARSLASKAIIRANSAAPANAPDYAYFYDAGIDHAWTVYLVNKHFPSMAKQLQTAALEHLLDPLRNNSYNTLSSALTVLAMDAYATANKQLPLPTLQAAGKDGKLRNIATAMGQIARGTFTVRDTKLWVAPADNKPAWYLLNQSGYDFVAPNAAQSHGLEVIRDYLDSAGKPITTLIQGDEVTVRLRIRALGANARGDIAIVDLLPGGFEPVLQYPEAALVVKTPASDEADYEECEDEGCGDEGEKSTRPSNAPPAPTLALPGSSFQPQHVEQREDRIVLYGYVSAQVSEFRYRVRANNSGHFAVAPIFAESMYERAVYAQGGPAGTLQVTAPKQP
ncbi:MAG TPA: alpha-2-macroglobulin family protein, partial [Luteimonas sp.]|nr:alpha-2-macroglobulin family protein [Luteimonas sp.]